MGGCLLDMLQVPIGVLLSFFGYWTFNPTVVIALSFLVTKSAAPLGVPVAALCGLTAGFLSSHALWRGRSEALRGATCGAALGLSFFGDFQESLSVAVVVAVVVVVSTIFALLFMVCEEEIVVYVSGYGGSYVMWQGLAAMDSDVWMISKRNPWALRPWNVEVWFNVLSLLLVGLIGSCVQIILIRTQAYAYSSGDYEYVEIP